MIEKEKSLCTVNARLEFFSQVALALYWDEQWRDKLTWSYSSVNLDKLETEKTDI